MKHSKFKVDDVGVDIYIPPHAPAHLRIDQAGHTMYISLTTLSKIAELAKQARKTLQTN